MLSCRCVSLPLPTQNVNRSSTARSQPPRQPSLPLPLPRLRLTENREGSSSLASVGDRRPQRSSPAFPGARAPFPGASFFALLTFLVFLTFQGSAEVFPVDYRFGFPTIEGAGKKRARVAQLRPCTSWMR